MENSSLASRPMRRKRQLVIDVLTDEILIYDLDRHKAHCLNQTAAFVWRHCNGKSTISEIARRMTDELKMQCKDELVWLALQQLGKVHLLEPSIPLPVPFTRFTRRELVFALGVAAVAVPLVTSIVSPTPAQASTCVGSGGICGNGISCCFGHICSNGHCT